MATIGENIKQIRKSKKISQKELSQLTGISINSIQGYEYGKFRPKTESVQKIATALSVDMSNIDEQLGAPKTTGGNIRQIRIAQGISQKRLADSMGVSSSMIAQYENGKRIPKLTTIKKIAAVLGVSVNDIIEEDLSEVQPSTFNEDPKMSQLIAIASQLNDQGINKAIEYVSDLSGNHQYKRMVTDKTRTIEG